VTSLTRRSPATTHEPTSPTRRTRWAAVGACIAAATLLSACDKPRPTVTVFSGTSSATVSAQAPCVLTNTCSPDAARITTIDARSGSQILVDVPKSVADGGWIVTAFVNNGPGKNTALTTPGAGSSVRKDLAARLQVPTAEPGGSYFLQVNTLRPSTTLTAWIVSVHITQ
jgi:hypothetical protein